MINICIYEDSDYKRLYPLTFLRPAYQLLVGINTLLDTCYRYYDYANITLHCREELCATLKEKVKNVGINSLNIGSDCLFINGRVILDDSLYQTLSQIDSKHNHLFTYRSNVVAAFVKREHLQEISSLFLGTPSSDDIIHSLRKKSVAKELDSLKILCHPYDILSLNPTAISQDFSCKKQHGLMKGHIKPFTSIYNEHQVFIDKDTVLEDFVVLNAEHGPIYIEQGVYIQAHTRIEGPSYIGQGTQILGGNITQSSIGPYSKVAGDVFSSVFQGYSNKAHHGFLGHSWLGEWVNLGAGTTTSNLKANYQPVSLQIKDEKVDTKEMHVGSFIGDHVKTGIGSLFNTGSIVGVGSTVFEPGFHARYIPPFSWGSPQHYQRHKYDAFIKTATTMMARRNISMSSRYKELLSYLYEKYSHEPAK